MPELLNLNSQLLKSRNLPFSRSSILYTFLHIHSQLIHSNWSRNFVLAFFFPNVWSQRLGTEYQMKKKIVSRGIWLQLSWLSLIYLKLITNWKQFRTSGVIQRFIATVLFRMVKDWPHSSGTLMLPDECGQFRLDHTKQHCRNKTTNHSWNPELVSIRINAPPRVERSLKSIHRNKIE